MIKANCSVLRRALLVTPVLIATNIGFTRADGAKDLENFVNGIKTMRAEFTQVSTKSNGQRARPTRGTLQLQRPGQFRFHYLAPFEQIIQSDGQTLTVHDLDLNQVTQRKLSTVAAFAPALAVASVKDFAALSKTLEIVSINSPTNANHRWVRATPRVASAGEIADGSDGFVGGGTHVEIGFEPNGALAELVLIDASGQRTALTFNKLEANPKFAPQHFRFAVPPGANLIKP